MGQFTVEMFQLWRQDFFIRADRGHTRAVTVQPWGGGIADFPLGTVGSCLRRQNLGKGGKFCSVLLKNIKRIKKIGKLITLYLRKIINNVGIFIFYILVYAANCSTFSSFSCLKRIKTYLHK